MMNLIIDMILVLILGTCVLIGLKRGFVRSICGFFTYMIAFTVANFLYRPITVYTIRIPFLKNMITEVEMPAWEAGDGFLSKVNIIFQYLTKNLASENPNAASETVKAIVYNYIAELLAAVIAFILTFAVVLLILKFLFFVLDKIVRNTPIIKQANGILGAVFGGLNGFFWTWALSNLFIKILLPIFCEKWPDTFSMEMANTAVLSFVTTFNPITYFFLFIRKIAG